MIVLSNKNINTNVCEFRADSAADILFLPTTTNYGTGELNTVAPCASGSVCIVTSTGDIFYLNGDENIWKLYGSSSGGGASMEEVLAITGDKTNLTTENKDNLVAAVNEVNDGLQGITEQVSDTTARIDELDGNNDNLNQFLTFSVNETDRGRIAVPITFRYLFIKNFGVADCYISESDTFEDVGEGKDGSILLEAGSTIMLENVSGIYCVCNQGEVTYLCLCYQNNKNCPFGTY